MKLDASTPLASEHPSWLARGHLQSAALDAMDPTFTHLLGHWRPSQRGPSQALTSRQSPAPKPPPSGRRFTPPLAVPLDCDCHTSRPLPAPELPSHPRTPRCCCFLRRTIPPSALSMSITPTSSAICDKSALRRGGALAASSAKPMSLPRGPRRCGRSKVTTPLRHPLVCLRQPNAGAKAPFAAPARRALSATAMAPPPLPRSFSQRDVSPAGARDINHPLSQRLLGSCQAWGGKGGRAFPSFFASGAARGRGRGGEGLRPTEGAWAGSTEPDEEGWSSGARETRS